MQDTTKVGKYINNGVCNLGNPKLNTLLQQILDKINNHKDLKEAKKALGKLGLTRLAAFEESAFIMNYLLDFENYKEKIHTLSKKLDIYIKKSDIDYSTIIDFSNEISSKMKSNSVIIARQIKDELTEEELRLLIKQIDDKEPKVIDRILSGYRKWSKKVKDEEVLYNYLNDYETTSIKLAFVLLDATMKKQAMDKTRNTREIEMELNRKKAIYKFKHKRLPSRINI